MASHRINIQDHEVLGTFSTDEKQNYCNDLRNRRFFVEPDDDQAHFDLNPGREDYTNRESEGMLRVSLNPMLKWIRDHQDELEKKRIMSSESGTGKRLLNVDFIARRGTLGALLRAKRELVRVGIVVTLCNGTYYIEEEKDATAAQSPKQFSYDGKKFCQYVTSVDGSKPDISQPVSAFSSYYSVTMARCGPHTLMFSSELKAERKDSIECPPRNYIEINTNKDLVSDSAIKKYHKYKTFRWWSMSTISGVPEIMVGWRDDETNKVTRTEIIKTDQFPGMAGGFWDADKSLKGLASFLSDIKRKITDDDPCTVYRLKMKELDRQGGRNFHLDQQQSSRQFGHPETIATDCLIVKEWFVEDVLVLRSRTPGHSRTEDSGEGESSDLLT